MNHLYLYDPDGRFLHRFRPTDQEIPTRDWMKYKDDWFYFIWCGTMASEDHYEYCLVAPNHIPKVEFEYYDFVSKMVRKYPQ